jgi:hypothetical protein
MNRMTRFSVFTVPSQSAVRCPGFSVFTLFPMRHFLVMLAQQILAKIILQIAPH